MECYRRSLQDCATPECSGNINGATLQPHWAHTQYSKVYFVFTSYLQTTTSSKAASTSATTSFISMLTQQLGRLNGLLPSICVPRYSHMPWHPCTSWGQWKKPNLSSTTRQPGAWWIYQCTCHNRRLIQMPNSLGWGAIYNSWPISWTNDQSGQGIVLTTTLQRGSKTIKIIGCYWPFSYPEGNARPFALTRPIISKLNEWGATTADVILERTFGTLIDNAVVYYAKRTIHKDIVS